MEHRSPPGTGISVVFDASLRTHPSVIGALDTAERFARSPGTPLVAPLDDLARDQARFDYATDAGVTLAELLAHQREAGQAFSARATLELVIGVATALDAVAASAAAAGLRSHGSLSPWRIAVRDDGTPVVLGYGLPDAELLAYLDEARPDVSIDTLRYAPPERLDDQEEDARADIYTLAIIAAEMLLGRPVFDGTPTSVAERVIRGDAPELIEAIGGHLGEAMLDLLCVATEAQASERFRTLREFLAQARLLEVDGPSLQAVAARAVATRERRSAPPNPAAAEPTRPAPDEPSQRELVPPVSPLPDDPDLTAVRAHARAIVERAQQLAEQAEAMQGIADQRAQGSPAVRPLLRRLADAVSRAQKASANTASTARLVELDDQVEDALLTLEMVRSAERLCATAARTALEILESVQAEIDAARAERDLLERARRQADELAGRAQTASEQAEAAASQLDDALRAGNYLFDDARERVATARERAEAAKTYAQRARGAAQTAKRQTRGADAMRDAEGARHQADSAEAALAAIQKIARDLDEAQRDALDVMATAIRAQVARARSAAVAAAKAHERAVEAARAGGLSTPALDLQLGALERFAAAARGAAERCEAEAASALEAEGGAPSAADLQAILASARVAAELAEGQAAEAGGQSDQLVSMAGEAAARAAQIAKLQADAKALVTRLDDANTEAQRAWEALKADTAEVTGRIARDAVQVAQRAAEKVAEATHGARTTAAGLDQVTDIPTLEDRMAELADAVLEVEERAQRALSRAREARGAAARELDEIAARHQAQQALQGAIDSAKEHARRCRAAVDEAWATYRAAVEVLDEASVDGLDELRVRAYEIIDIAEFQSGEAQAAAASADGQADVAEARSHASTAASFEARITADLPEALQLLEKIRAAATAEIQALAEARRATTDALDRAREAVRAIGEMRATGSEAARDWTEDPAVQLALDQLLEHSDGADAPLDVIRRAEQAARSAESATEAHAQVPLAEQALAGLVALRERVDGISNTLDEAVRAARAEIETRENAVRSVTGALESIRRMEQTLAERSQRLFDAIDRHGAISEPVRQCRNRMRKAVDKTGEAHDRVARAAQQVASLPTAAAAHALRLEVEGIVSRVEEILEVAADAEAEGTAASEREATERVEAERRALSNARNATLAHLGSARAATTKAAALLREADEELTPLDDPEVRRLHDAARDAVRRARDAALRVLGAARACQLAPNADQAIACETEAAEHAGVAQRAVVDAKGMVQQAADHARRTAEEAKALANVKAEIQSILASVDSSVDKARGYADEVAAVIDGSDDPDTLATLPAATDVLAAVENAATKLRAAAPMALEAASLDVAQGLLDTCRKALERVDQGVDDARDLVQRAQALLSQEAERAAERLAAARDEAARPALEARAVAEKAQGWVDAGERVAEGHSGEAITEALEALRSAAAEIAAAAESAEATAAPARKADSVEAAQRIGAGVAAAASEALAAAERARACLDAVKAAAEAAAQLDKDAQEFRLRAAEAAAAAEICATDAAGIAEALERHVSESKIADDDVAQAFREVKRTAKAVATAAATAFERTEATVGMTTLDAIREATEAVEAQRQQGEHLLNELQRHDRTCRELIETVKRRAREESKRSNDEALRARLRKRRNESTAMKREELRKQFEAERDDEPEERPNMAALRERLRSRRRPAPPPRTSGPTVDPATQAPRRIGDRPRRQRQTPDESTRLRKPDEVQDSAISGPVETARSREEREASRRRRLERRRRRESTSSEVRPRIPTSRRPSQPDPADAPPDAGTEVGLLAPDDLQEVLGEDPRTAADALLERLRRGRSRDRDR